jgi:hypothetical protein
MDIGSGCYCFRKCEKELPVVSHFCEISLLRKNPTGIFAGFVVKEWIQRIFLALEQLQPDIRLAYVQNDDLELAKLLTAGVDILLNTP